MFRTQKDYCPIEVAKFIQRPCINSSNFLEWKQSKKGLPQIEDNPRKRNGRFSSRRVVLENVIVIQHNLLTVTMLVQDWLGLSAEDKLFLMFCLHSWNRESNFPIIRCKNGPETNVVKTSRLPTGLHRCLGALLDHRRQLSCHRKIRIRYDKVNSGE